MSLSKLCFQAQDDAWPKFNPTDFEPIGYDLIKDLMHFYIQARGARWEEGFAAAIRLMRRHDGGSALRALYRLSLEAARRVTMNKIKNSTKATFEGVLHTIEIYIGPIFSVDSAGNYGNIHSVRMWNNKDFMKDIVIKINLYPWIPEIPVIPIEYTGYHTNPKMYGKPETNKWFIKNNINK